MTTTFPSPQPAGGRETTLDRGAPLGRYFVLGKLGQGGMGEVYAAFDPELDRKVAVKLLRSTIVDSEEAHALLLREAQATAKLQHPNVVVVHDVGTVGDRVFIAMELVDGETLREWVRKHRPPWREILKVFAAAGRGLAAAHAAGLVHRDFKPDNVMIARDGRVRVMDFGLARAVGTEGGVAGAAAASGEDLRTTLSDDQPEAEPYLAARLTRTGMQMGTPGYMALEQLIPGTNVDARTDQFAFCVALYEALYGERPFGRGEPGELLLRIGAGQISPPPAGSRVPPWVRRVLVRGLRANREERFASMDELLAALAADPAVRRRKWLSAAAALGLMLLVAFGASRVGARRTLCAAGGGHLAGVWDASGAPSGRKEKIHQAFVATGAPYAETAFASVTRLLDGYVARWVSGYGDACEATHVRGEQSAEVLDLRMECLRDRLRNLRALTDVLARADRQVVENAVNAAGALPDLDQCGDVAALRSVVKPPADAGKRKRVLELREELARMVALRDSGQCQAAANSASALIAAADATAYDPLRADVLFASAMIGTICTDPALGVARLKAAYGAAVAGRSDRTAAEAAIIIPGLAVRLDLHEVANDWFDIASAAVTRAGRGGRLEAWLLLAEGDVKASAGDNSGAVAATTRSWEIERKLLGEQHPDTLMSMLSVGNYLAQAGRFAEAYETDRQLRALAAKVMGREHPFYAMATNNMGEALNALGRHGEARDAFTECLDVWRRAAADPVFVTYGLTGLGRALLGLGLASDAVAPLERALSVRVEKRVAAPMIGETRFALARALWSEPAEHERARALAAAALTDYAGDPRARAEVDAWLRAPR